MVHLAISSTIALTDMTRYKCDISVVQVATGNTLITNHVAMQVTEQSLLICLIRL